MNEHLENIDRHEIELAKLQERIEEMNRQADRDLEGMKFCLHRELISIREKRAELSSLSDEEREALGLWDANHGGVTDKVLDEYPRCSLTLDEYPPYFADWMLNIELVRKRQIEPLQKRVDRLEVLIARERAEYEGESTSEPRLITPEQNPWPMIVSHRAEQPGDPAALGDAAKKSDAMSDKPAKTQSYSAEQLIKKYFSAILDRGSSDPEISRRELEDRTRVSHTTWNRNFRKKEFVIELVLEARRRRSKTNEKKNRKLWDLLGDIEVHLTDLLARRSSKKEENHLRYDDRKFNPKNESADQTDDADG